MRLDDVQVTLGANRHNGLRGVPLPPFHNPTVLITRPKDASERFCAALVKEAGAFEPLICPAFEAVPVNDVPDDFDVAIFTSGMGVAYAPKGRGRVAYCVGDATARAAQDAGYSAQSAQGDVRDLCKLILTQNPSGRLLHVRGENSIGFVSDVLSEQGLRCFEVIAYRKDTRQPDEETMAKAANAQSLIFPLFSVETVSIVAQWQVDLTTSHIVAMSDAVARQAAGFNPVSIVVCDRPNLDSMVAQTGLMIA